MVGRQERIWVSKSERLWKESNNGRWQFGPRHSRRGRDREGTGRHTQGTAHGAWRWMGIGEEENVSRETCRSLACVSGRDAEPFPERKGVKGRRLCKGYRAFGVRHDGFEVSSTWPRGTSNRQHQVRGECGARSRQRFPDRAPPDEE